MDDRTDHGNGARLGRHLAVAALVAAATIGSTSASADVEIFLKLGDIKGESKDDKHKDEIDVLTWSWGVVGPTLTARKDVVPACTQQLAITKYVDLASAPMMASAALNTTIPTAKIIVRKSATQFDFLELNLSGVNVKSESHGGSAFSAGFPMETVVLGFASATLTYKSQNPLTGEAGPSSSATLPASCP